MGATHPILEKHPGPLARGSRNTLSQLPWPYLNIVKISTILCPPSQTNIIDKDPSQITREAKEAIHIRRLDPSLNRNIGKMSIPHCFDHLLGAKPKQPWVGALAAPQSVDEIAPPSQIPGLNLTQFNNIGNFRPNVAQHIPRPSTRASRARNLFNWSSIELPPKYRPSSLAPDMNWVMSFLHLPQSVTNTSTCVNWYLLISWIVMHDCCNYY